jgi:hypothetical protein
MLRGPGSAQWPNVAHWRHLRRVRIALSLNSNRSNYRDGLHRLRESSRARRSTRDHHGFAQDANNAPSASASARWGVRRHQHRRAPEMAWMAFHAWTPFIRGTVVHQKQVDASVSISRRPPPRHSRERVPPVQSRTRTGCAPCRDRRPPPPPVLTHHGNSPTGRSSKHAALDDSRQTARCSPSPHWHRVARSHTGREDTEDLSPFLGTRPRVANPMQHANPRSGRPHQHPAVVHA